MKRTMYATLAFAAIVTLAACDHIPFLSDSDSYEPPLVTIPSNGPVRQLVFRPSDGDPVLVAKWELWEEATEEEFARPTTTPPRYPPQVHVADGFSAWQVPTATVLSTVSVQNVPIAAPVPYGNWSTASYLTIDGEFIASSIIDPDSTSSTWLRVQSVETGATISEMQIPRADGYLVGVGSGAGNDVLVMSGRDDNGALRFYRYNVTSHALMDSTDLWPDNFHHIIRTDNGYVSPNGRYILSYDGYLLDMETGGYLPPEIEHGTGVMAFGPDGTMAAVACRDSCLVLESLPSRTEITRFDNTGAVKVTFALESPRIATWNRDGAEGTIAVWDTETGEQITEFRVPDVLRAFAISPDGRYIAAGYSLGAYGEVPTGEVRIWEVSTEEL